MNSTEGNEGAFGELSAAINSLSVTPYEISWLYARAAVAKFDGNVARTAREIGMHRRSLQRLLESKRPGKVRVREQDNE